MAKYQKYAEYQDSGIEWLGEIPKDWEVLKLKYVLDLISEKSQDNSQKYVGMENIASKTGKYVHTEEVIPEGISNTFKENDVLFGKLRPYLAKSWLASFSGICSSELLVLRAKEVCPKFLQYYTLTDEFINQVDSSTYGSKMPRASWEFISLLPLPKCSYELSLTIANFLDHETAKIDTLIAKQEKLIELLKEKRQAVISHAVTKGLNPDVPMKDSGVEWLGPVPEHWELVPLKYLCSFSGGGTPTKDNLSYWTDGNIPWVSPKDMKTFWISETQDYITEKAVKESSTNIVEQNSLLMVVRSGILQRTIPIAINTVPVTMNQDMKALKFGKRVLVEYIANLIHGNTAQLLLEWSKEGATVESIEHEYLANSLIPLPSLKEQEEITQVIAKKMKVYAELTEKAKLQITLLQERRTALISSAVTGKIDVRNWQYPKEATTELSQ
ncbi:restriction endonuclease subunit S [Acinetobacter towneri]|uniref:restriction endonuclease subunit S n=1 Tax=Acinetobacter towneri TaxID=202956 RepID=UPI003A8B07A4